MNVLLKPASGMCNMNCTYCFYCDEMKNRKQASFGFMSEQTLKNVIRKTLPKARQTITYAFQGGEPTLRGIAFFEKALQLQQQYNKNGVCVNNVLQTNGILLDETWCQFLKEHHFLVGLSVDGTKEIHDSFRHTKEGTPTFERVKRAAKWLDFYEVDYNILTVVTDKTAQEIDKIYAFYKCQNWKYQQYIACLEPLGEERRKKEYAITPQQYGTFLIRLFQLWYADWEKGTQPYIRQFENYIHILLGYYPEACEQSGICGIQTIVEADGSVYPCDFYMLDDYYLGNFNTDQLEQIDKKRAEIGFVERSMQLSIDCCECQYLKLCRGGCQRNREFDTESGTYKNYFCTGYQMFFDACMPKLEEIVQRIKEM